MLRLALCSAALLWACPIAAEEPAVLSVPSRNITLGDLASIPTSFSYLAERIVAQIPPKHTSLFLDEATVLDLVRRQAPLLSLTPRRRSAVLVALDSVEMIDPPSSGTCFELAAPISASDFIEYDDVIETRCDPDRGVAHGLTFDRSVGATRTMRPLATSTYLGPLWIAEDAVIPDATQVQLRIASGPVVVTRQARTLQPSRLGDRVFVENSDGSVISLELMEEQ